MAIFLDTGKIKEVDRFMAMGIIRGVTTNPTILAKDGVTGGMTGIRQRSIEIARLIAPYPLSVEVTTNDSQGMLIHPYSKETVKMFLDDAVKL